MDDLYDKDSSELADFPLNCREFLQCNVDTKTKEIMHLRKTAKNY